jgi:hypothetical protein
MKKLIIIILLFLTSCEMAEKRKIVGNYYIVASDIGEQMNLAYNIPGFRGYSTIVKHCVFAVGYNDKYIVVKQHPYNTNGHPNKEITNYYIVPIQDSINWRTLDKTIIPLNEVQFEDKRKELGIENIQFTIVYKDLE